MSYFDDASLVMIPSGYKTSKVYSVKPLDGSGDLTFTRSNDTATRVGPDGLIEKVRTNLALYSEQFDNAAWAKAFSGTGSAPVVTANAAAAPDGTITADRIVLNQGAGTTSNDFSLISQSVVGTQIGVFSIWMKSATGTSYNVALRIENAVSSFLVTSEWQRFELPKTTTTNLNSGIWLRGSYGTDLFADIYAWGAQIEAGDIATDYIPTTTAAVSVGPVANVPRLDYLNSSCPRLLLEPQRTNLVTYSEQFDNAAWVKTNATVTANTAASPDGYTNADKLIASTANAQHAISQSFSVVAGNAYTFSAFVKSAEYTSVALRMGGGNLWTGGGGPTVRFNLLNQTGIIEDGTGVTFSIVDYGNDWYRCSVTGTCVTSGTSASAVYPNEYQPFIGDNTSGLLVYGIQTELGAYATSYIPTLGAAATRGADIIPNQTTTIAQAFTDDSQGTILFDISNVDSNITGSEARWRFGSSATPLQIALILESAGLRVFSYNGGFSLTPTNKLDRKIAIRFNGTQIVAFVNGVKQTTYNAATAFDIEQLTEVQTSPATFGLNQFILFPTALSDADCIALTA